MYYKVNDILSFDIWYLKWTFKYESHFCIYCFLCFLLKNKNELDVIKSCFNNNLKLIKWNKLLDNFKEINNEYIYLSNGKNFICIQKTYNKHPYCIFHEENYFLDTKIIYKTTKDNTVHNIENYKIEEDKEILWRTGIVKYVEFNYTSTALSNNPLSFISENEELFFVCSWYFNSNNSEIISKRISIMEWIERFCLFSYDNSLFINKNLLNNNKFNWITYLNIYNFVNLFDKKDDDINTYLIKVFDIKNNKEFYIDSKYILFNPKIKNNYINSTWWASHFLYKQCIINWLEELIERDSLMKLWLYRYSPDLYSNLLIWSEYNNIVSLIWKNFDIKLFKVKSLIWYTTLAIWINIDIKADNPRFIYWSSHSFYEQESINWAIKELYMTYNNLRQYDFKLLNKEEVISVMDHYYYYQDISNFKQLDFLFKSNKIIDFVKSNNYRDYNFKSIIEKIPFNFYILNLTPKFLFNKWIYVVKVISWNLQTMDFWYQNLRISKSLNFNKISKDSLLYPHPFF